MRSANIRANDDLPTRIGPSTAMYRGNWNLGDFAATEDLPDGIFCFTGDLLVLAACSATSDSTVAVLAAGVGVFVFDGLAGRDIARNYTAKINRLDQPPVLPHDTPTAIVRFYFYCSLHSGVFRAILPQAN